MGTLESTKYSLDSWVAGRSLTGHVLKNGAWQYFDPIIIAAMMAGVYVPRDLAHAEVELKDNSIELTVWWKESQ